MSRTSEKKVQEELQSLVLQLSSMVQSGVDPLSLELQPLMSRLKGLIKRSLEFRHIELDMEALYDLAVLVHSQSKHLRDKSSVLYVDPFLVRLAMLGSSPERLAEAFLQSWRPGASRDVLSHEMMKRSYYYWSNLKEYAIEGEKTGPLLGKSLESLGIRYEELISEEMEEIHDELTRRGGRLLYEDLLGGGSLNERLRRAVLISFMLSYGYAVVEKEPLKKRLWIVGKERVSEERPKNTESIVTVVS